MRTIRHAYRPLGLLLVLAFLTFMEMSRLTGNLATAALLTALICLFAIVFS